MRRGAVFSTALCLLCGTALAHTEQSATGGLMSGLLHPVQGLDHLLAMVAVGIWGAFLGAPLVWALPVVFPLLMVIGAVLGIAGVPVASVEAGIAISVVLLGSVILTGWRAPVAAALALVAVFGVLHGHAHGTELPEAASPAAYSAGFVIATGLLHVAGIALGRLDCLPRGRALLRGTGAAMALAGTWMLARVWS
ncbi:HupE/UreJ family protein [Ramlibacter henchirensis]|uniref:HupE/UreJ family protein n=1 Tax=Ramlibacter henchirensis TaxID=204072 RepID=A0A4Z0BRJ0_9BURK|nr:HupE/UreJ family protein [Ramlibacter henchirensis]